MFEIIIILIIIYAIDRARKNIIPDSKRVHRSEVYRNNYFSDTPNNHHHDYHNDHYDSHSDCDSDCGFDFDGGCGCGDD